MLSDRSSVILRRGTNHIATCYNIDRIDAFKYKENCTYFCGWLNLTPNKIAMSSLSLRFVLMITAAKR